MPGHNPAGTTPPPPSLPVAPGLRAHLRAVEEAPMDSATPTPNSSPREQQVAAAIQEILVSRKLSLADPETAAAYDATLEVVSSLLIDNAYRSGRLGEEQHRLVRALIDAARMAPRYLA